MSTTLRQRLEDPAYRDAHLCAAFVLQQMEQLDWYDSAFLRRFEAAKRFLDLHSPGKSALFVEAFAPLKPGADFAPIPITDLFTQTQHALITDAVSALCPDELEKHELHDFGRHVVLDHPFFVELQQGITAHISEMIGQPVSPGYNFLSLYGSAGRCAPHMDQPISMYTVDYCIDQDVRWPIYFSPVVDWPTAKDGPRSGNDVIGDPELPFTSYEIAKNDALLFCGSSQWHYRDVMPANGFCNLLFFHYYPKGCEGLVHPARWPAHFAMPQLQALLDLFDDPQVYNS